MSPKLHKFAVHLERDGEHTAWGIRLVGGANVETPLIITRVLFLLFESIFIPFN